MKIETNEPANQPFFCLEPEPLRITLPYTRKLFTPPLTRQQKRKAEREAKKLKEQS